MVDVVRASPEGRSTRLLRAVQHVLVASMVFLGLVRSVVSDGVGGSEVALAVGLVGWYAVGAVGLAHRSDSTRHLWVGGLSLLCLAAVWVSPDFAWVSFAVFVTYANLLPPVAAVGAIVALAVGTGGILVGRWPHDGHWAAQIVGPLVGAAVAGALVGISRLAAAETAERQRLLDELLAARDDLARAHLDAGVRAERERLAREIHDTLAQGFTSIVMLAQTAEAELVDGASAGATERVRLIETTARDNLAEARALVAAFAPAGLTDATLREALDRLASRFTAETGIAVEVEHPAQELVLGRAHEVVVLRVAQESLTNVRRHAAASSARVRLSVGADGGAQLEIADDGRGIDPAHAEGFGLRGMRDRVDATGGRIEVGSPASGGTVVRVQLPAPSSTEESP